MRHFQRVCFFLLIVVNIFLSSWFVRHNDLLMTSDIARDFYLLDEIRTKGLILIGPRASGHMYHGPLWAYLNFPAFVVGGGNPIVVGWFWVALSALVLGGYFVMAKKLFNELTAWCFVLMSSLYFNYHTYQLLHPAGALFALPFAFFFWYRYAQTRCLRYLICHLLIAGVLAQFEIAVGVLFLIISGAHLLFTIMRTKRYRHLLAYGVLAIPLSTWALFDIRHGFIMSQAALRQLGQTDAVSLLALIQNRLDVMTTGIEFLRYGIPYGSAYAFYIFLVFLLWAIKTDQRYRPKYLLFLYTYVSYFSLSLLNRFRLLPFYVYPVFGLVFLFFSSLVTHANKKINYAFFAFFLLIYATNLVGVRQNIRTWSTDFVARSPYSWSALSAVARTVYRQPEQDFGYFVFSPDIMAYEPRFAMEYWKRMLVKSKVAIFEKKPVIYVVIAPRNGTYMTHDWIKMKLNIVSEPAQTWKFPSGYTIEKYALTPKEMAVPFDPGINPGLFYR